jgi:hypothetical protein
MLRNSPVMAERGNKKKPLSGPQRRQNQRLAMASRLIEAQAINMPGPEHPFWERLRWGGAGFLASQALHHFLTRR